LVRERPRPPAGAPWYSYHSNWWKALNAAPPWSLSNPPPCPRAPTCARSSITLPTHTPGQSWRGLGPAHPLCALTWGRTQQESYPKHGQPCRACIPHCAPAPTQQHPPPAPPTCHSALLLLLNPPAPSPSCLERETSHPPASSSTSDAMSTASPAMLSHSPSLPLHPSAHHAPLYHAHPPPTPTLPPSQPT
jgi:hypothetical protein